VFGAAQCTQSGVASLHDAIARDGSGLIALRANVLAKPADAEAAPPASAVFHVFLIFLVVLIFLESVPMSTDTSTPALLHDHGSLAGRNVAVALESGIPVSKVERLAAAWARERGAARVAEAA